METGSSADLIVNSNSIDSESTVKGLSMLTAAIFIVGEMSGTGVLSLPKAMEQSNWSGLALILGCCALSGYCGIRLSSCWTMILEKDSSLKHGVRDPFSVIAFEAAGKLGRLIVEISSYIQLFGVAVIFLLIAAHNFASLFDMFFFHFCDWTIAITILMAPVAMLGTPKDFWPIAVGAMLFTGFACILIFAQSMRQISDPLPPNDPVTFNSFFVSFGTILFCFGGAVMFPTIQSDMINPSKFYKSVILSYLIMLLFYLPVGIAGLVVFAGLTKDNIIDNLQDNWIKTTVLILITGHLLTAFTIILNPVFQGVEKVFNAPISFSVKRVLIRSCILLSVLFVAQSVPNFGPILSFIGGSTVSLTSFILPCIFYVLLCRKSKYSKVVSKLEMLALFLCVVISAIGGAISTYSSIDALVSPTTFVPPCYFNRTQ